MLGATLAILMFLSIIPTSALAQSQSTSGKTADEWEFTLAPYLLLPWMNGKTAIKGNEVREAGY